MQPPPVEVVDAFDLPEWVGTSQVTWRSEGSVGETPHVTGVLCAEDRRQVCDVLAVDLAYPAPVVDEQVRHDAHQAWTLGEVLLVSREDRLTLAAPGHLVDSELVLECLRRLAKAVGAPRGRLTAELRL